MDCSVIPSKKYKDFYVVSTTDFFYPLVEDPYLQGRIACCNVLSDMYALGVVEVDNLLMLLAASLDMSVQDREIVTKMMIKGFNDLATEAKTQVSGGQTVLNPWPIIGGVAKSICRSEDIIMPRNAQVGDVLVLTKPLGTQIAVNVKQWISQKKPTEFISDKEAFRAYAIACESMGRLNRNGAILMHKYGAHAATDVTGFGILGHANNLNSNQTADVSFILHTLPVIRGMTAVGERFPFFKLMQGKSAETSGGLLICLPADKATAFIEELEKLDGQPAWIVGRVVAGDGKRQAVIAEDVAVVEV